MRPPRDGLTLVELMVALAILVTVSASTVLVFRGITRAWKTGELRTERYQQARLLFDLFERELSSCVMHVRYPLIGSANDLFFIGALPGRAGFVERGYSVQATHDLLCHDEEPADGDPSTGDQEICGRDITQLSLTYFDGAQWVDTWASDVQGALPKAVRVVLAIGEQKPETFETIIHVPAS